MAVKTTVLIGLISLLVGLAAGRYSLPAKVVTKTVTVAQTDRQSTDRSTITHKSDGTVVIQRNVVTATEKHETGESSKSVEHYTAKWTVSGLVGIQPLNAKTPAYGAGVDYRVLGPIEVGAWGLSDGTVGLRLGLSF